MSQELDMSDTLATKTDRLNAVDARNYGPFVVRITGGKKVNDQQQPIMLKLSGGHMPYWPCKIMRDLINQLAGVKIVGRMVELYCDESVRYGKHRVGGIRISGMSGIGSKPITVTLMVRAGQYQDFVVRPLKDDQQQAGAPTADMDKFLSDEGLTRADIDRWRTSLDRPILSELKPGQVAEMAGFLAADKSRLAPIRALMEGASE